MLAAFIDLDEGLSTPSKLRPDTFMAVTWDPSWSHPRSVVPANLGAAIARSQHTAKIMVTVSHRGN
ncbi:MAG: hypothetical protein ACLQDM_33040 [Bradyrhizobium sp.]